ncbi:MAG: hypothetical protein Q9187_002753 [Circinaria calcarea]
MASALANIPPAELVVLCELDRGPAPLVLAWTLGSTATIIVVLRLYVKTCLRHSLGWDDYTMVIALITSIIDNALFTKMFQAGVGRHIFCVTPENISETLKWSTWAQIVEVIALALVKISVCLLILRLIDQTSKGIARFLKLLMIAVVICHIVPLLLYVLQCRPLHAVWNPQVQGECYSSRLTYTAAYIAIGLDAFTDLACAVIPVATIYKLQMKTSTKVAICILMGLGVFTAGCAIAKAVTLKGVFDADYTWGIYTPALWSVLEVQLAMNIASIPTLRPLFSKIREASRKGSHSSGKTLVPEQSPRPMHLNKAYDESSMPPLHGGGNTRRVDISVVSESDLKYNYHQITPPGRDNNV